MNANDVASSLKSSIESRVRYMLAEHLRNFFDEAKTVIDQAKFLKLDENCALTIILKSLKDITSETILKLIRNSSLSDEDKCLLNVSYGNPKIAILLMPTKTTKEEIFSDELTLSDKRLVRQSFSEWPQNDMDVEEED